jgi:hypothetical protein
VINTNTLDARCFGMSSVPAYTPALLPMTDAFAGLAPRMVATWPQAALQAVEAGIRVQGTGVSKARMTFDAVNGNHPGTSVWSPPL